MQRPRYEPLRVPGFQTTPQFPVSSQQDQLFLVLGILYDRKTAMDEADRQTITENIIDLARDLDFDDVSTSLLSKGFFEKHHIEEFESKPSRKKKSLELLSAIQRRGPKAFQALYESLVEIQPHLAKILRPAPPADDAMSSDGRSWISMGRSKISKPITQPGSPMDISSSETVTVDYKMSSEPLGLAVIINNKDFTGKRLQERKGTDKDRDDLKVMFEYLGLTPQIKNNQTGEQIEKTIAQLSKCDHSQADCVAVAILSHGEEGVVYGTDDKPVEIQKLIAYFNADKCLTLRGKPKLFFIQACRGAKKDAGVEAPDGVGPAGDGGISVDTEARNLLQIDAGVEAPDGFGPAGDGGISLDTEARNLLQIEVDSTDVLGAVKSKIPNQSDMLLGYATIPGFVSWRNRDNGSWFIQALTEVTRQHAKKEDLGSMMTMVNARVAKEASDDKYKYKYKQTSVFVSSLCEKLFFFPSH